METKKKVLFITESHKLASGFGTYAKEVIPRLHATGKYEIAQFACYSSPNAFENTDWLIYGIAPEEGNEEYSRQHQMPLVQWGAARFEQACLDFKPDIVVTYRDPWMDAYIADSPFLPFFHWVWMPTVDSEPQKTEWLYMFNDCDGLMAYSEYGKRVLEEQTHGRLKVYGCASPAIDPNIFNIIPNQEKHKAKFGLPEDSFIVGTVMRNQKRKMFPELMKSFKIFLNNVNKEIAEKSFLYLHTSHPERHGWNITSLVHEYGLGSKVLTTYICKACGKYFCSHYRDSITVCDHCGKHAALLPGVSSGIDHKELVNIYNLMDLYVQYAVCEGFGMPQVEAAACGTPIAAIDYSAMEDVVRFTKGYPISPKLERELETNADRSGSNNEELARIIMRCAKQTKDQKKQHRLETRKGCIQRYTWDHTAKAWEEYFDKVERKDLEGLWDHPPLMRELPDKIPSGLNHGMYCEWIFNSLLQNTNQMFSYKMLQTQQNLNTGANHDVGRLDNCTQQSVYEEFRPIAERRSFYDQVRTGKKQIPPQPFITEARRRLKK